MPRRKLTAEYVYSLIEQLSNDERDALGKKIGENNTLLSWTVGEHSHWDKLLAHSSLVNSAWAAGFKTLMDQVRELAKKLHKHRNPRRNAERDAEVMRLTDDGKKTSGQVVKLMKDRWPKLTEHIVRSIISRERRKRTPK